ncbi:hypothetical protein RZS08_00710, partial [Arthrospira platensis SPKY1]|nr:hypothetical protein [Arthrospira platensis SPKY1]
MLEPAAQHLGLIGPGELDLLQRPLGPAAPAIDRGQLPLHLGAGGRIRRQRLEARLRLGGLVGVGA